MRAQFDFIFPFCFMVPEYTNLMIYCLIPGRAIGGYVPSSARGYGLVIKAAAQSEGNNECGFVCLSGVVWNEAPY